MLSEKLFLILVAGSVLGLVGTFVFNRDALRASRRTKATPIRSTALLAGSSRPTTADAVRSRGPVASSVSGSGHQTGVIIATEQRELSANARRAASQSPDAATASAANPATSASSRAAMGTRALPGAFVSGVEPPAAAIALRAAPDAAEAVSVFTPSVIGLPFRMKTEDVWTAWPDQNLKNITGSQGLEALNAAFGLVADSRAGALAEDLIRKGIPVSFGTAAQFTGEVSNVIAFFHSSPQEAIAAGVPVTTPTITFNPLFLHEDPRVLAAALAHEATHFQQFLDGSAWDGSRTAEDLEFQAWSNEAAFWEEMRGAVWPINTFLEQQSELAYRTALRGEAALRDLLIALEF